MDFTGRTSDQILRNPIFDDSSWHFFQARSWIDFAKRSQLPSAVHYAAFELRYGIEYLLFELLQLVNESLTQRDYEKCLRDPGMMKKMLSPLGANYQRLAEFTAVLLSSDPHAPKFLFWDVGMLFRYWGTASEYLHFVGAQKLTYQDANWLIKSLAALEGPLEELWVGVTGTVGKGIMRPSGMQPEVHAAWLDFSPGAISKDDLSLRLRILDPVLRERLKKRSSC